jgi:hypothetical protein
VGDDQVLARALEQGTPVEVERLHDLPQATLDRPVDVSSIEADEARRQIDDERLEADVFRDGRRVGVLDHLHRPRRDEPAGLLHHRGVRSHRIVSPVK